MALLLILVQLNGVFCFLTTISYAVFATSGEGAQPRPSRWWQLLSLWCLVAISLTPWLNALIVFASWIWGSATRTDPYRLLDFAPPLAALASGSIAGYAVHRRFRCTAPSDYVQTLVWLSAGSLAPFVLSVLGSFGEWSTLLPFTPVVISVGSWVGVYRRQLRDLRLSLGSMFALVSFTAVGLAMTEILRSL